MVRTVERLKHFADNRDKNSAKGFSAVNLVRVSYRSPKILVILDLGSRLPSYLGSSPDFLFRKCPQLPRIFNCKTQRPAGGCSSGYIEYRFKPNRSPAIIGLALPLRYLQPFVAEPRENQAAAAGTQGWDLEPRLSYTLFWAPVTWMFSILLHRNRLEFLLLVHSFEESNSLDFLSGDETRR
jgi:hypothetical protein